VDFPIENSDFPSTSNIYLVGGIPTPLKNMSSSMGRMTSHILGKIKAMFETTNQIYNAYPLVNIQKDTKRLQNIYINYQWAIVYSYVSLPEGMYRSCCMSMLMLCNLFKQKAVKTWCCNIKP